MIRIAITLEMMQPEGYTPQVNQSQSYATSFGAAGAAPFFIPPTPDVAALRALYDMCDAVCLPGGPDVAPQLYGAEPHTTTRPANPAIENTELQLLRWALADHRPIMAICRGMQLLNVALGGTLVQDIASMTDTTVAHNTVDLTQIVHDVALAPDSLVAALVGSDTVSVNSRHHQALGRLADGLVVTGTAPDGIIEAVAMPAHPLCTAVQFHPEVLAAETPWAARFFAGFVEAVAAMPGRVATTV